MQSPEEKNGDFASYWEWNGLGKREKKEKNARFVIFLRDVCILPLHLWGKHDKLGTLFYERE